LPNENTNGCPFATTTGLYFEQSQGTGWTTARKNQVIFGAGYWNGVKQPAGFPVTNSYESATLSGARKVVRADMGPVSVNGALGSVRGARGWNSTYGCYIGIDPDVADADIYLIATHEMGHERGLPHTGQFDTSDNVVPAMTTCRIGNPLPGGTPSNNHPGISADDIASLLRRNGGWPLNPNSGFEMAGAFLGLWQVAANAEPTGGLWGPGRIRMVAQSNTNAPWFVDHYATVDGLAGARVAPEASISDFNASANGTFAMELYARPRSYTNTMTGCGFWGNINLNSPQIGTWSLVAGGGYTPATDSWLHWSFAPTTIPSGWTMGTDLLVRVYKGSGAPIYVENFQVVTVSGD